MRPKIITTEAFYHNLGKLFYAIAFADKQVREEEFAKLQLYVLEHWLDYDDLRDVVGSDASHLIEMVFEGVEALEEPADEMYDEFVIYKRAQPHLFTEKATKLILETASAIAHSFSDLNKSELVMLNKLKLELEHTSQ